MAQQQRKLGKLGHPGPYLAEVTNHLDTTYMGGLEVALIKGVSNFVNILGESYPVKYLSPFAGITSVRFTGANSNSFNDVQKSYGMWMVPPDIGSTVMVLFIDGDPNQGYWFGCVVDKFQDFMIPGIAATQNVAITEEQKRKYGTTNLPAAEMNKKSRDTSNPNISSTLKPIHPFAERLLQQGLLLDTIRGVTSSSARREVPSQVFGISTPGPLDPNGRKGNIGYADNVTQAPISRLGGSTFVMDDGDTTGQNELVRLRTRTGHQILLHNTNDLIYIANSKGTAWIELTSNGKIDIYAQDSVSIHTEADFNFRADRDINLEAGRNIHIKAGKNMETNISGYNFLRVDQDNKIFVGGAYDKTINKQAKVTAVGNYNLLTGNDLLLTANGNTNIASAGKHLETASQVHMNSAGNPATPATPAEIPPQLPLFSLPNRQISSGWENGTFFKAENLKSIMQRVPTHEPWDQHESINTTKFSSASTDVTLADRTADGIPPNPASAAASADSNAKGQEPANPSEIIPGTCDPVRAKEINLPQGKAGQAAIKAACAKLGVTNPYMIATMLGVAGGESLWQLVVEKFGYTAERLLQVFPSVFKGDKELAKQWAGNPGGKFPEFIYGYQTAKGQDLGNKFPGDGEKYIGRGYIGLTGRGNYTLFSKLLYERGLVNSPTALLDNPELVNDPTIAGQIVVIYFLWHPNLKKANQNPGPDYFEKGYAAVGYCTKDIYVKKKGYYECFLGQLQAGVVGTGSGGIMTDSSGNPVRTGSGGTSTITSGGP